MTYTVSVGGKKDFSLIENDLHASVLQNLAVLFATKKGTIPMYRNFGLEMKFVDMPINIAKAVLMADVISAVREFEPRAEVIGVSFMPDDISGIATPIVEVKIIE